MGILFAILLFLTGPVFYVIGLFVFIRWMLHGGRSAEAAARLSASSQIRAHAEGQPRDVAKALEEIADTFSVRGAAPVHSQAVTQTKSAVHEPPAKATGMNADLSVDLGSLSRSLDNINVLLYLGAFLIVVSAGIFVGFNFSVLSGTFKTMFLALFAAIFYGVGLFLFLNAKKLRPAGVTFTGIGLVLLPLVGLAAYNFTALHDFGPATWFVTSVLTLIAYIITLTITRQTYVAYFMAFTTLSIFESSVSLFNVPVYWFGWAMALASIVLLSLSQSSLLWEDASGALTISANVFLPVSLLLSWAAVDNTGNLTQLGVTIGLAGAFYASMAKRYHASPAGAGYWAAALASLPAALGVGLWTSLSRAGIAVVMLAVCAVYLAVEYTLAGKLSHRWRELLALVTGLLPLAGIAVVYDRPGYVVAILVAAVVINGYLAIRVRSSSIALFAILSLLALPYVFVRIYLDPALPWSLVAVLLLAAVPALWWWARRLRDWPDSGAEIGALGYLAALALAIFAAWVSSPTALMYVGVVATLALYGLSALENRPEYLYAAAGSFYLALLQPAMIAGWGTNVTSLILLGAGVGIYGLGAAAPSPKRSLALRYSGLLGPFLGALVGLYQDTPHIEPVLALAIGGGLLLIEARRQRQALLQEFAGGIIVLSVNWYFSVLNVTQTQVYTIPWAVFAAFLGYRRRADGHQAYDGFVATSLAILTLPLASQALASDGQVYGLLLILEAIAFVFLGMALSYRLVTLWGVATLVAEVLYQLRDFFDAIPKYLISAGLGLGLLAVAIVMLQRRKDHE